MLAQLIGRCLQGGTVFVVLEFPYQEGYLNTRIFRPF